MCGRTVLTASPETLRDAFGVDAWPAAPPRYNVTPSQAVATVRLIRDAHGRLRRQPAMLRWGLVPAWADSTKVGHKLALARAESVASTPAFREAYRSRRCLVVVDGFYEWKRDGKSASQPFLLRRDDHAPFALAGLWERWTSSDGEVVESCAILTQAALPPVDAVHDRMPVVLGPSTWDLWLGASGPASETDLASLLAPAVPPLVAAAVSAYVNDPRHDDVRCFEPPAAPAQQSLF